MLALGLLTGRITSLLSVVYLTSLYGAAGLADIVILIMTFPYWIAELFMVNPFSAAFVPLIHDLGFKRTRSLFNKLALVVGSLFFLITVIFFMVAPYLAQILAPGLNNELQEQLVPVLRISLLSLPVLALAAVARAFLQARHRYSLVAWEHLFSNLTHIIGILYVLPRYGLVSFSWLVVFGSFLRLVPQALQLRRHIAPQKVPLPLDDIKQSHALARYTQSLSSSLLLLSVPFVGRSFASLSGEGSITLFNYALQVIGVPFWVVLGVFPTVVFPLLCEKKSSRQRRAYRKVKSSLFSYQLILACLLTLVFLWFFFHGYISPVRFMTLSLKQVSLISLFCFIGMSCLPFQALTQLMTAVFNARKESHRYVKVNLFILCLTPFIFFLGQKFADIIGLYVAFSFTQIILFLCIWTVYSKSGESLWFDLHKKPILVTMALAFGLLFCLSSMASDFDFLGRALLGFWIFCLCFGGCLYVTGQRNQVTQFF